jgi:hypothetical protein
MKDGVGTRQAFAWDAQDKEFSRAVTAIQLVRAIDFILKWDDVARSGKPLTPADQECIDLAMELADDFQHGGFLDAYPPFNE